MNAIWEDIPNRLEQKTLDDIIRLDICRCLKNGVNSGRWEKVLGYTLSDLKRHLESLFVGGMSWDNCGLKGWTIDHIIPRSFFLWRRYEDSEFQYCWSRDNLQPLWQGGKNGNSSKNGKVLLYSPKTNE